MTANSLKTFSEYNESAVKLKVIHFCPLDGFERDPDCKRIVVTADVSQRQTQTEQPIDVNTYLIVVFYGCYAKTPFKKSSLKIGQTLTLQRFRTGVLPKNKVFKCDNY